jgi:hypothetical protein
MDLKFCSVCNVQKELTEFYSRTRKNEKVYVYQKCKVCTKLKKKKWEENNKERRKEISKKWVENNKERKKENDKKYRDQNVEKIKKYKKDHYEEHKIKYAPAKRKWERKKRETDNEFRILSILRGRVYKALHSKKKADNTLNLIGCTITFFRHWLTCQFYSNMTWDNYGSYWEIDHVIPCAYFDLENEQEQFKCFNWKNCRPLEANKNSSKSDKYIKFDILMQELKVYHFNKQHIQIAGTSL